MNSISSYSEPVTSEKNSPTLPAISEQDSVWKNVPQQMPAATEEEIILHGDYPSQRQVRVILSQTAIEQISQHAHSDLNREVGGALLGRVVRHQAQTFVEALQALPAPSSDHGPLHFTFSADTWAYINQRREASFPELEIVGWFHTHPNLSVFFSSDDVVVHTAAFTLPWQVGMVVDPIQNEVCFFGWENDGRNNEIFPIAGFYEWLDNQPNSLLEWHVAYHQHWAEPIAEMGMTLPRPFRSLPAISPWWGVFLGGASLLANIVILLYLYWGR